jgi:hypothetical protein
MKFFLPVLLLVITAAGCHSQQPVSTFSISYSATAPASCTTAAPCTIEYSDTPQISGACPATIPTVGCTSAPGTTTCAHPSVTPGVTYCAVAQTVQAGATSAPTAVIQVVIPPLPTAPATPSGSATPSNVAEVTHDTSTELALNKDGSLRVTRNFIIQAAVR